jgi:ABC-type dipeptide/oligopeptide/nickel transport system permease subunit
MAAEATLIPPAADPAALSRARAFWIAYRENRGALLGLVVVAAIVVLAILADVIAPYSPTEQFRDAVRMPPVWADGDRGASSWARTASAATCSPACCMARACRSSSVSR